jgi:hypothetical protein
MMAATTFVLFRVCLLIILISRLLLSDLFFISPTVKILQVGGYTKLSSAAYGNRIKEVEALIKYGADVNVQAKVSFFFFSANLLISYTFSSAQFSNVKTIVRKYILALRSFQKEHRYCEVVARSGWNRCELAERGEMMIQYC